MFIIVKKCDAFLHNTRCNESPDSLCVHYLAASPATHEILKHLYITPKLNNATQHLELFIINLLQ